MTRTRGLPGYGWLLSRLYGYQRASQAIRRAGHFSTSIFAVDNNGDLAGAANGQGFVSIAGTVTMFCGSGASSTRADGLNDSGLIVGRNFQPGSTTNFNGFKGMK